MCVAYRQMCAEVLLSNGFATSHNCTNLKRQVGAVTHLRASRQARRMPAVNVGIQWSRCTSTVRSPPQTCGRADWVSNFRDDALARTPDRENPHYNPGTRFDCRLLVYSILQGTN